MSSINGKNIIIGVTGGIAAYKSADLTRRLKEAGADVRIVMTTAATEFVTPLTFQALSGHDVFFDSAETANTASETSSGMQHIELARWADAIIIAPASANTIAKLAHGRADNILTTLCLASEASKFYAPAMNRVMWHDLSTQNNCKTLNTKNWTQLGPASGLQACGEMGEGRMLEVADIVESLQKNLNTGELQGLNIVITAGPTFEAIDPVRYIGNRSSGRMGYAIASAAQSAGANVSLISGPSHLAIPEKVSFTAIESAGEMKDAVMNTLSDCHIYISTAAISDYRVDKVASQKIKKTDDKLTLQLIKNEDLLSSVAQSATRPYVVGFAAETENLIQNAKDKLVRKNLDMIIANDVSTKDTSDDIPAIGFNSDYNALHVFWVSDDAEQAPGERQPGEQRLDEQHFELARKSQLAKKLINLIAKTYKTHKKQTEKLNEKNTA